MTFNSRWNQTTETWASVGTSWGESVGASADSLALSLNESRSILRWGASADSSALSVSEVSLLEVSVAKTSADSLGLSQTESSDGIISMWVVDSLTLSSSEVTAPLSILWERTDEGDLELTDSEASALQKAFASADSLTFSAVEGKNSGLTVLQDSIGANTLAFSALESSSLDVVLERSDTLGLLAVETTDAIQYIFASEDQGSFASGESSALVVEDWPYESLPPATSWDKSPSHSDVWVKVPPETSEPW